MTRPLVDRIDDYLSRVELLIALTRAARIEPDSCDRDALAELLAPGSAGDILLRAGRTRLSLPAELRRFVMAVAGDLAAGRTVLVFATETTGDVRR